MLVYGCVWPLHILGASDQSLSGLTVLVNVKMPEMANQIKVGRVYCWPKQSAKTIVYDRNVKWPTALSSDANYSIFFSNMAILRAREREICVNCLRLSLSTKIWSRVYLYSRVGYRPCMTGWCYPNRWTISGCTWSWLVSWVSFMSQLVPVLCI